VRGLLKRVVSLETQVEFSYQGAPGADPQGPDMAIMPANFTVRAGAPIGRWHGDDPKSIKDPEMLAEAIADLGRPVSVFRHGDGLGLSTGGEVHIGPKERGSASGLPLVAHVGPCLPSRLGDASFCKSHGLRFAYVAGAMANGIASPELVEAMARAGMLGFYGAAGLPPAIVEAALERISVRLGDLPWGTNLIHSPYEPDLEEAIVSLYLRRNVRLVSASAYLGMTPALVRYRLRGVHRGPGGTIVAPNRLIAKVSRVEVAEKFFSPAPEKMLIELVNHGLLSREEAELGAKIPMAEDLTAEADSGGHTDNRSALALLPAMLALRDRKQTAYSESVRLRVGLGGGISTPHSAAAAFAMGAAYLVTGSVNQACLEAGTSDTVRRMLAETQQADVAMAPAADMFEMGVDLQVLKRGTLFPMRAHRLRALYREYPSLEAIPDAERLKLEKTVFRAPLTQIWKETEAFWQARDPQQAERALRDPHHRMALVFRWYLGQSSRWANRGETGREIDYQVWCGPAMGAFNEWTRGSIFEGWRRRRVVPVAQNILHGAASLVRANSLRAQGLSWTGRGVDLRPRSVTLLEPFFSDPVFTSVPTTPQSSSFDPNLDANMPRVQEGSA